jgi:hypothetical protein
MQAAVHVLQQEWQQERQQERQQEHERQQEQQQEQQQWSGSYWVISMPAAGIPQNECDVCATYYATSEIR